MLAACSVPMPIHVSLLVVCAASILFSSLITVIRRRARRYQSVSGLCTWPEVMWHPLKSLNNSAATEFAVFVVVMRWIGNCRRCNELSVGDIDSISPLFVGFRVFDWLFRRTSQLSSCGPASDAAVENFDSVSHRSNRKHLPKCKMMGRTMWSFSSVPGMGYLGSYEATMIRRRSTTSLHSHVSSLSCLVLSRCTSVKDSDDWRLSKKRDWFECC